VASRIASDFINYPRAMYLWSKFHTLTMAPKKRFLDNLFLASYMLKKNNLHDGCYVECGTWAGGMSFAIMNICASISEYHFFDSYEGLPPATEYDGHDAIEQQRSGSLFHNNNSADYETFRANLERFKSPHQHATVNKGWFADTLPGFSPSTAISILRLDGDWYESTMTCLENLFDKVREGGLIIIDDYYDWDGCSRAVHDFLSRRASRQRLRSTAHGVGYIVKVPEHD